jgi:hypothetical protein
MTGNTFKKASTFDFQRAISQLFGASTGKDFSIRLVLWTAVLIGVSFVLIAKPYVGMMGIVLEASWVTNKNPNDAEAIFGAYSGLGQYVLPIFLATMFMWAVYASAETALHKKIFRDEDAGFFPLRFGADEVRVMGAQFMVYLMVFGIYFGAAIALVLFSALGAVLGSAGAVIGVLLAFVGLIVLLWFLPYFSIRMAPAAALTVKRQQLTVTKGWGITHKRAGSLFLAYLLIFILGYVAVTIVQTMAFSSFLDESYLTLMTGLSDESPRVVFEQAAEKLKQPGTMIILIVCAILYAVVTAIWWLSIAGVANYAVQWEAEENEPSVFD